MLVRLCPEQVLCKLLLNAFAAVEIQVFFYLRLALAFGRSLGRFLLSFRAFDGNGVLLFHFFHRCVRLGLFELTLSRSRGGP